VTTAPTTTTSTRPPTTTTLTTTTVRATTTTTRTVPPIDLDGLVLRGDGLGIVLLGDPMEDAIATLTDLLGPQSGDRLTEAPFGEEGEMGGGQMACWTATGTTCIDYLRVVSWDALGLCVVFSDWTEPAPGAEDWELTPAASGSTAIQASIGVSGESSVACRKHRNRLLPPSAQAPSSDTASAYPAGRDDVGGVARTGRAVRHRLSR
jgi:hypothetical protein